MDKDQDLLHRLIREDITKAFDRAKKAGIAFGHRFYNDSLKTNNNMNIVKAESVVCYRPVSKLVNWVCGNCGRGHNFSVALEAKGTIVRKCGVSNCISLNEIVIPAEYSPRTKTLKAI